jgi:hypothetical protein
VSAVHASKANKTSNLSGPLVQPRKLEVVHMDLMGPISPATTDDGKYALNVIDEFSEMSASILLKSKADASKEATNLLTQWQNQNECKVKFIRTGNGIELLA